MKAPCRANPHTRPHTGCPAAPGVFQRLMNHYLQNVPGDFRLRYLDDILIYINTHEEHLEHILRVLQVLQEKELYAKGSK